MERDFTAETDAAVGHADSQLKSGNFAGAVESLLALEKQTRSAGDAFSTGKLLVKVIDIYFAKKDWNAINDYLVLLSKKRGQLKQAITLMVQRGIALIDLVADMKIKLDLIDVLRQVTEGKIFVEVERARLTKLLSSIKEKEGKIAEAADILHELQIETFGSMDKREKVEFILEQMRLGMAKKDFDKTQIISRKISSKFLNLDENEDLKLRFFNLMVEVSLSGDNYLDICKHYRHIYESKSIQQDEHKVLDVLKHVALFVALSPFGHEQSDLMNRIYADKNMAQLPIYKELLKCLITDELIQWPIVQQAFRNELAKLSVFQGPHGNNRWSHLQSRVIENNIRVIAKHYDRIRFTRLTQLLDLTADKAEEYFAKMVTEKVIHAKMDRPAGLITFSLPKKPVEVLNEWSSKITTLLSLLEKTNHLITKEEMVHQITQTK